MKKSQFFRGDYWSKLEAAFAAGEAPDIFAMKGLAKVAEAGIYPVIATPRHRRRFLRTVLSAKGISNPVLSFEEIGIEARPSLVGLVAA